MNNASHSQNSHRSLDYFVPGQLLFLVEHPGELDRAQLTALIRQSNTAFDDVDLQQPREILTFPRTEQRPAFSLVFADVTSDNNEPGNLLRLLERLEEYFDQSFGGLTLRAVSPNWLGARAPFIGTGGPGAIPIPVKSIDPQWHASRVDQPGAPFSFDLPSLPQTTRSRRGIEVAILDTAPCTHDLARAYSMWQTEHPIICSMLRPNGPLRISYADYDDLIRMAQYEIKDHRYIMSDHGLFVAGLIHSIAPQASLHLIEVLNATGVGDIESIAKGLRKVVNRRAKGPVVVNCSFVINFPTPDEREQLARLDPIWQWLDDDKIRRMSQSLEWIFDVLWSRGIPNVAAAGNDGDEGKPRQAARFPAAFRNVIGVGALDEYGQPTIYSNFADTSVHEGFETFGGAARQGKTIPGQGVLGVYIGAFPDGSANTNGWAEWAGTSFAAPVISGSLARLMSSGVDAAASIDALRTGYVEAGTSGQEVVPAGQPA